jgi:hypothetical protein
MCNGKVQLASVIRLHDGASCGSVPLVNGMSHVLLSAAYEASAAAWVLARMRKAAGTLLSALEGIRCGYHAWGIASLIYKHERIACHEWMSYVEKLHRGWTMHRASELPHRPFLQPPRVSCNVGGAKGRFNRLLPRLLDAARTTPVGALGISRRGRLRAVPECVVPAKVTGRTLLLRGHASQCFWRVYDAVIMHGVLPR